MRKSKLLETADLRVVLDTNILVSGLFGIKNSPSSQILQAVRTQKLIFVTSPTILKEIGEVINRQRIVKLTKMSLKERVDFMDKLIERSEITEGTLTLDISRDVADNKFIVCAQEAKADYIITGDEDLLELKKYQELKIVTPREFVKILYK